MDGKRRPGSLFFPLLLVAAGVFILLINIGSVPGTVWQNLVRYWPVVLIIAGLDGLYRRDGWIGPLVLLGLGIILLLGNLNYLEMNAMALLWRFWPVILVAIGLDVILGHRGSIWGNLFRVALGLLLVAGIVWLAALSPVFSIGVKTVPFEQKMDAAVASNLHFALAAGELNLNGDADTENLVEGTAGLPKEMNLSSYYTAPKDGKSSLSIEGDGVVILPINSNINPWNFNLNSEIPLELSTEMGVGQMRINLTGTQVDEIDTELGVGQTILTLPDGVDVNGSVSSAVGELVIRVPEGSEVILHIDRGIVGSNIPEGFVRESDVIRSGQVKEGAHKIELTLELAIGGISIEEID